MRLLFVGDVVGRAGRNRLISELPGLRDRLKLDAVIVNGENAAGGFGLTAAIAKDFFAAGADLITLGNHSWDQREMINHIASEPRIIRPLNYAPGTPGRGIGEMKTARGKRVVVLQILGRLFMGMIDDAMRALEAEMNKLFLGGNADAIIVDVHAEATSEKAAIGYFLDGKVSLVVGTHTHIPTADQRILPKGTGFMSDVGMTGDHESIIGMTIEPAIQRWRTSLPGPRLEPAMGDATLCAVFVETDDRTGLTRRIEPVRLGGILDQTAAIEV